MAGGTVQISDVIVPDVFTPYSQNVTEEKAVIIQAGVAVRDAQLDGLLAGGGLTFDVPSWKDLDNEEEDVINDDPTDLSAPSKTGTLEEIAVRLNRHKSWSTMDLTQVLAGSDPAASIASRIGYYWTRRMQACYLAVMAGIFADNDAAPSGSEHVLGDLTNDISGDAAGAYSAGVTDFQAGAFIDTLALMGDSQDDLGLMFVHSLVYNRMQKNNLIDFIPDATGQITIPTYLGRTVLKDDAMPHVDGVFQSWIFGQGTMRLGVGTPQVPTEIKRIPEAGKGGGMEVLHNRVQWCFHPVGHAYVGTASKGGPSNASTTNNLANVASWRRVFPERKQIKIARLITREY